MTNDTPSTHALRGAVDLSSLVQRAARPNDAANAAPTGAPTGSPAAPGAANAANSQAAPPVGAQIVFETDDAGFGQVADLSRSVPVVVVLWASWSEQSTALVDALVRLVRERGGRLALATADADRSPQLVQALQAQSMPTVVALVAGSPVPLFAGVQPDDVISQLFDQLLELAAQHGATGTITEDPNQNETPEVPVEKPLPPLHQAAVDAITRGDYEAASASFRTAIAQDPRDTEAVAGLAQANLLGRLQGKSLDSIRSAAASAPHDLEAQLDVADLDVSGGHIDDAFDRLLGMFASLDPAGRSTVRERIVELFEVVGLDDPRVVAARRRLAALLY